MLRGSDDTPIATIFTAITSSDSVSLQLSLDHHWETCNNNNSLTSGVFCTFMILWYVCDMYYIMNGKSILKDIRPVARGFGRFGYLEINWGKP